MKKILKALAVSTGIISAVSATALACIYLADVVDFLKGRKCKPLGWLFK